MGVGNPKKAESPERAANAKPQRGRFACRTNLDQFQWNGSGGAVGWVAARDAEVGLPCAHQGPESVTGYQL